MAEFDTNYARSGGLARADAIDQGLRAYMLSVYNYMAIGLALTGLAAIGGYMLSVTNDPSAAVAQLGNGTYLTEFGRLMFISPLKWVVVLAPLAMVFFLSFRVHKMSVAAAQATFWIYAGLVGLSLSTIFLVYTQQSITQVFFVTAASFGALSLWGYTTGKDISGWGSFLRMGVFGIIIAMLVNFALGSPALDFAISVIGVLVFAGLTAYDTQQIKEMYYANDDGTVAGRKAIMGALRLYLDFINLFLMLLQLFGNRD